MLGALAAGVGRGLAAALRPLAGPWWLAQFDPASEAARAARAAFQAAFPGARQREALLFCRAQVPMRLLKMAYGFQGLGFTPHPSRQHEVLLLFCRAQVLQRRHQAWQPGQ